MSRNNQQRRAAKAKERHRRAAPPRRDETPPSRTGGTTNGEWVAAQHQVEADGLLRELARLAAALSGADLKAIVAHKIGSRSPGVLAAMEQQAVGEVRARLAAAWEGGWQPRDLHHASARLRSRIAHLAATLSRDDRYASMLRTSCVATRLGGGHANNALPQRATANVNCRIIPTSNAEETRDGIVRALGDTGITVTFENTRRFGAVPTPIEPTLLAATTALTKSMWGDIPVIPTMSTGATDGRQLRQAGIPTFGVSGLFSLPGESNAHGRDEKMRVKSFYQGLDFLDQLVRRIAGAPKA